MTLNAIVVRALGQSCRLGKLAAGGLVTRQAPAAEVRGLFLRPWNLMGIVARNTTEPAVTRAETPADFHLRDVSHGLDPLLLGAAINRVKLDRGQAGAIVEFVTARPADPLVAQEVALLADGRAECRRKVPWIDDRQVLAVDHFLPANMQLSGAVAPLAADRFTEAEDGLLVMIDRQRRPVERGWNDKTGIGSGSGDRSENCAPRSRATGPTGSSGCTTRLATGTTGRRARPGTPPLGCPSPGHISLPRRLPPTPALLIELGLAVNFTAVATFDCELGRARLEGDRAIRSRSADGRRPGDGAH